MSEIANIALHGFLGLPVDWEPSNNLIAVKIGTSFSFEAWAKDFNRWVESNTDSPRRLLGYSMGGRLALHALLQNPNLWKEAIVISTNPGIEDLQEREKRIASDYLWAKKFRKDSWKSLMSEWNAQSIFNGSFNPNRKEEDYNREVLASQLENFSLGKQEYLLPEICKIKIPIRWITGSLDVRSETLAQKIVSHHSLSSHISIKGGSHRVHLEFPIEFKKAIL